MFNSEYLSKDNTHSCASCDDLAQGGTDRLPRSRGHDGQLGKVNAPTVYNSGFNFRQFWDGRAESLESQIDGVLVLDEDPKTFGLVRKALNDSIPIYSARDVSEALDVLERAPIAVVVSEIKLRSGETTGFIKQLKDNYPSIMTVVVTALRDGVRAVELINSGRVYRYLPKPAHEGLLKTSIERAVGRHQLQRTNPVLAVQEKVRESPTDLNPGLLRCLRGLTRQFADAAGPT